MKAPQPGGADDENADRRAADVEAAEGGVAPGPQGLQSLWPSARLERCRTLSIKAAPAQGQQLQLKWNQIQASYGGLDGRNRAVVIAESLARVIAAIRIASARWRSYLYSKLRN